MVWEGWELWKNMNVSILKCALVLHYNKIGEARCLTLGRLIPTKVRSILFYKPTVPGFMQVWILYKHVVTCKEYVYIAFICKWCQTRKDVPFACVYMCMYSTWYIRTLLLQWFSIFIPGGPFEQVRCTTHACRSSLLTNNPKTRNKEKK